MAAVEFLEEQLKGVRDHLSDLRSRLDKVACSWETADRMSDMTPR